MLLVVLCSLLLQLVTHGDAMACIPYQSSCNLLTGAMCCGFPASVLCLPDNRGGTSCLSPLDVDNLSPAFTSLNPAAPMLGQVESAARNLLNPATDPLANPILDPLANPILDPVVNPVLNPFIIPLQPPQQGSG